MDFSADGRYLIASCEFDGGVIKVDVQDQKVLGRVALEPHGMPQDVKLSPDGAVFYVADMQADGLHLIDGEDLRQIGFIPTGKGAHGLYVSRDSRELFVSNRHEGSVSVIDLNTRKVIHKWRLPGGGSPDMGGISADGRVLWLSGRYNSEVYAIDTSNGGLLARIPVGRGPHGLCVYPQPGRYSLGTYWDFPLKPRLSGLFAGVAVQERGKCCRRRTAVGLGGRPSRSSHRLDVHLESVTAACS